MVCTWRPSRLRRGVWAALLLGAGACRTPADRASVTSAPLHEGEPARSPTERSVRIASSPHIMLAGTLSLPSTHERAPAVLLLSGSGPQDRDGARPDLPGYRPLRDLAAALSDDGLVVLRLDDRGMGASTGDFPGATTLDFADDAAHAVAWLRAQPEVDAARIALVGHSEGALVALLVAADDPAIRALVLLGAAAHTGREIARWQRRALVVGDPVAWPVEQREAVLAEADRNAELAAANDAWLRTWFALDPRTVARRVHSPTLLLHGDTDRQVPSAHADELAAALRAASPRAASSDGASPDGASPDGASPDGASPTGRADVTVRRFPSTNHLFLEDPIGDVRGYQQLPSRALRGDVTRAVVAWLHGHLAR